MNWLVMRKRILVYKLCALTDSILEIFCPQPAQRQFQHITAILRTLKSLRKLDDPGTDFSTVVIMNCSPSPSAFIYTPSPEGG
jgi:hypothetical protein